MNQTKIFRKEEKTMMTMIMNKPQSTQMTSALETGLGFMRSNYHYGWDLAVDSKPECNLFEAIIADLRQLHKRFSGSFHSLFKRAVGIGTGTQ